MLIEYIDMNSEIRSKSVHNNPKFNKTTSKKVKPLENVFKKKINLLELNSIEKKLLSNKN